MPTLAARRPTSRPGCRRVALALAVLCTSACGRKTGAPSPTDGAGPADTATQAGDIEETKAIRQVFGAYAARVPVSSTKSMHGHLMGATGAVEFMAAVLALHHQAIPPTINLHEVDPELNPGLNFTPLKAVEMPVEVAFNNTFGFGGHTSTTVFKKYRG